MTIQRRDFLILAPAAALAAVPALAIRADIGDARLLDLERQRNELIATWSAEPSEMLTDARFNTYGDAVHEIDQAITATPAQGRDGLLVKWRHARYWTNVGDGEPTDNAVSAFEDDLIRLLGGAS